MKKTFLAITALAAMLFAGCTSSDELTTLESIKTADNTPTPVQFGTYMGKVGTTRAYTSGPIANATDATKGETALSEAGFGVFSYLTTADYSNTTPTSQRPDFMYNQQITWNGTSSVWEYSPLKYWPNGVDTKVGAATDPSNTATETTAQKLSFFAYAPYMTEASFTADYAGTYPIQLTAATDAKQVTTPTNGIVAMTKNTFTENVWVKYLMPNANASAAVDLLWGTNGKAQYDETDNTPSTSQAIGTGYNMNLTKQTTTEKVKFLFKHALAKLGGNTETAESASQPATAASTGFMIKLDVDAYNGGTLDSKTLVTVEKVEIMDTKSANTEGMNTNSVTTSNLANSGWFNIEQGTWSNVEVATAGATYSVVAENATANDANTTDALYSLNPNIKENPSRVSNVVGSAWQATNSASNDYTGGATGVTVDALPLFAKETVPGLFVIPGVTQTIYVRIKYYVRTLDANLSTKYSEVVQTITNKVDLSSLASNKFYKIIMHLGLTSVKFEAIVSDWQTKSDSSIDTDGHETGGSSANESHIWLPSNVQ